MGKTGHIEAPPRVLPAQVTCSSETARVDQVPQDFATFATKVVSRARLSYAGESLVKFPSGFGVAYSAAVYLMK